MSDCDYLNDITGMGDFLNEVTEKVNKAIMDELSTKGYCYWLYAENILRRELGLPQTMLDTGVGWIADSDVIGKEKKDKEKENKMANIKNEPCIATSTGLLCMDPWNGEMFRTTADAINDAIATVSSSTVKVTTYEPSCTFDCQTAHVNLEDFYKLCGVPVVKEDTKKEKENKMEKNENMVIPSNVSPDPNKFDKEKYPGYSIFGIKVLAPNKVVAVRVGRIHKISSGYSIVEDLTTYKQICREPDVFDLKYAVALALTKHLHRDPGKRLTTYGLERMTEYYLTYSYDFNKEVDRALKVYARREREEALAKAKAEEIKMIKERRAAKQKRNRERRRERRMNGQS